MLVFHFPYHVPLVICDLFSENIFQSVNTLTRDERDYLVCELEVSAEHLRGLPWCSLNLDGDTSTHCSLLDNVDRLVFLFKTRATRQLAILLCMTYPLIGTRLEVKRRLHLAELDDLSDLGRFVVLHNTDWGSHSQGTLFDVTSKNNGVTVGE